jgi:hypothetical protein
MAMWFLACSECKVKFAHASIEPLEGRFSAFTSGSAKPQFPTEGLAITCPKCGKASLYQRHQLIYQVIYQAD